MKKTLGILVTTALFATPVCAAPYVSVSSGLASQTNSDSTYSGVKTKDAVTFKSGVPFVGAVGMNNIGYRLEVALGYQSNSVDKLTLNGVDLNSAGYSQSALTYLANGYYDINIKGAFTPYLTAGLGGSSISQKSPGYATESRSVFTYQLGAGVGFTASDNIVVDLGYRYLKPSNFTDNDGGSHTSLSNNFLLGVRYTF